MRARRLTAWCGAMLATMALAGCVAASGSGTTGSSGGAQLVQQKCTRCHSIDRVQTAQKDRAGWTATVERMVTHGLQVTDAEKAAIIDYLAGK